MRRVGFELPHTNTKLPRHRVLPCLLRDLAIARANQIEALDITSIPRARGFAYLVAVLDGLCHRLLGHRVSLTRETDFGVEALAEAIARHDPPEIVNTDQASRSTRSDLFAERETHDIAGSRVGRGHRRDHVFVERFWRSVQYGQVCPKAYESISAARAGTGGYVDFYTALRQFGAAAFAPSAGCSSSPRSRSTDLTPRWCSNKRGDLFTSGGTALPNRRSDLRYKAIQ